MIKELNKDQLSGLANLCFDLAKGAFGVAIVPAFATSDPPLLTFLRIIIGVFWGLAFAYSALLILKLKEPI